MMVMSHQEQTALCTVPSAEEGSEIYSLPFGRISTEKKKNKNLWHLMGQTLFTYIKYGFILKIPPNLSVFHWILFENKLLGLQKYKGPDALYEFKFHDLQ